MKPKPKKMRGAIGPEPSLRRFLAIVATHAVKVGYTVAQLNEILAEEYVAVAAKNTKLRNGRVNKAALAAVTGITRAEISRVLGKGSIGQGHPANSFDVIERLVVAWKSDPDYLDVEGGPIVLPIRGATPSLTSLSKKYASDLTPKSVLVALKSRSLIRFDAESVALKKKRQYGKKVASIQELERLVSAVGSALGPEVIPQGQTQLALTEIELDSDANSKILGRHIERAVPMFLEELTSVNRSIQSAHSSSSSPSKKRIVVVFSVEVGREK